MARITSKNLVVNVEPKKEIKAARKDTKRGAFIEQLFQKEGVTSETSVLGKLWKGVHDDLGYGIKTVMVGAKKNDKGEEEGGVLTWFGVAPNGPVWAEKKPKPEKKEKPEGKAKPAPKPKAKEKE